MLSAVADILDLSSNRPRGEEDLLDTFVRQLRFILLGASVWREDHRGWPTTEDVAGGSP